jgi:alkylated DNA repair dioxygenase AlkB
MDTGSFERLPVQDADICYARHVDLGQPPESLLRQLIATVPWRAETVVLWGKRYAQPRLIAWYGDDGARYTYSGIQLAPLPWTPALADLKQRIESIAGVTFNSVLLNYYRDGHDSMGFHSDDERELGPAPVIASISLGEQRTFILKHRMKRDVRPVRLSLASGSVLLMRGDTQKCWKHGVEKEKRVCAPRINLTFRRILTA